MASNKLHLWPFHIWDGPPPNLPRMHVSSHTRPGTLGTSHTAIGKWGDPFSVRITSYYATLLLAQDAIATTVFPMLELPLLRLWYGSVDYRIRYQTMFKIVDLEIVECRLAVRVVGDGLDLPNAGILRVQVTLVPHAV